MGSQPSAPAKSETEVEKKTEKRTKDEQSDQNVIKLKEANHFDVPKYENTDEIIWETFYHQSGVTYLCMYQSGERFVLNMTTKEKYNFPKKWYNEGLLVTEDSKFMEGQSPGEVDDNAGKDDRSSFINHPKKGKLQTYLTEEKQYVHFYFDEDLANWVRLPISWELQTPLTRNLMKPIQEAIPDWKDEFDILASLRSHSYNSDQCISTYFTWGETATQLVGFKKNDNPDLVFLKHKNPINGRADPSRDSGAIEQNKLREEAEEKARSLQETLITLKAEHQTLQVKCETLQMNRPKTAANKTGSCRVDKSLVKSFGSVIKVLRRSHTQLDEEFNSTMKQLNDGLTDVLSKVSELKISNKQLSEEFLNMKNLYRREALQRKLLYNQLQELKGNIRVFCRCRKDDAVNCGLKFPSDTEIVTPNSSKTFTFNRVFGIKATQEEVFEEARPIITSCIDGYNVCIMAYGQTGSGKTYTMQGSNADLGVNIRSLKELLQICRAKDNMNYTLKASMMEIYNESIHDLLSTSVNTVELRAQGNKITVQGLQEIEVRSLDDIDKIMAFGQNNRRVAETKMNSQSSRSHLIFKVTVTGEDKATGTCSVGSLTLCDLAGSERVDKSEATGQRLVEAAAINKSLTSLGQVFNALKMGQLHVPYRNSKLTHLLQPSLSGDAKACLFIMISPDLTNSSETLSTLQFGSNAQQIELGQAKKTQVKISMNK